MICESSFQFYINIIIAISAILAAIFSGLTLRQAMKFHIYERESNRAYLTPSDNPGYFKVHVNLIANKPRLFLSLTNHGKNPASLIKSYLYSFNQADIDNPIIKPIPKFMIDFFEFNPIPYKSVYSIKIDKITLENSGIHDFHVLITNYLLLKIEYYDQILGKCFNDKFIWLINSDESLVEINKIQYKSFSKILWKY